MARGLNEERMVYADPRDDPDPWSDAGWDLDGPASDDEVPSGVRQWEPVARKPSVDGNEISFGSSVDSM